MQFFKIFSMTLLVISTSLFGFCALTLQPATNLEATGELITEKLNFGSGHSDIPKMDPVFRSTHKVSKVEKYYEIMEMNPIYFNVRLEKIRDLSLQPRCVDR